MQDAGDFSEKPQTTNQKHRMKLNVTLTMTEEMLGTKAANPDVFADFIASKHPSGTPQRDELDKAEHREEAGTTVFHRDDGKPGIYDYQIKGFFKDACGALRNADDTQAKQLTAYKSKIDGLIFVEPRFIRFENGEDASQGVKVGVCERPLRADTAQGPRVSVCRSETVPAGTRIRFSVVCLATTFGKGEDKIQAEALIEELFRYGQLRGLGAWRNSGKGRFTVEISRDEAKA